MTKNPLPTGGGSYVRDPKNGKLTQTVKPPKPAPKPEPIPDPAPTPERPADKETDK